MNPICYPDEVKKPFPGIAIDEKEIVIKFPDNSITRNTFPGTTRVVTTFAGDGVTRSFKMPYFNAGTA